MLKMAPTARRAWRKLHLAVDAEIGSVTADGACDGTPNYDTIAARTCDIPVIILPHVTAVLSVTADHHPSQRDQHIAVMAARECLGWQEETGYGQRSLVETAMGSYKTIIGPGPGPRPRSLPGQHAEAAVGVAVLNRMLHGQTPSVVHEWLPETIGEGELSTKSVFMQQRPSDLCITGRI